ncbi:MAG: hypothetical protein ABI600_06930 [Luteolibacter sp.]
MQFRPYRAKVVSTRNAKVSRLNLFGIADAAGCAHRWIGDTRAVRLNHFGIADAAGATL